MGLINLTLPSDGETIDAADVNTPFNTISTAINGNLDNANIKANAAIDGSKIADNSIPNTKMLNGAAGWTALANTPNTVTANGNRNYDLVFNSVDLTGTLSPGMKLQLTRTVAAPSKSTLLNGSTQYYTKTSPNKLTFTDDFVVSAWIKVTNYDGTIVSRFDGNSGWIFQVLPSGQINLSGHNGAAANASAVTSYGSIPLNKWFHVAAQLDMSAYTTGSTNSYVMIDGVDVPAFVSRSGTNPTALVQAGTLSIGARGGGTDFFDGATAQVAVYNAKVTQATIKNSIDRGLSGSETSLASAYSFSNSITDLNTSTPNDLTAQGSAVATNADSPFANAVTAGLLEYAEINSVVFSTNTTVNVRVPDTCQIPTTGGVSAVSYSTQSNPYGLPYFSKVIGYALLQADTTTTATSVTAALVFSITAYIPTNAKIRISFYSGGVYNSTTNQCRVSVWDGTVGSGTALIGGLNGNDSGQIIAFSMSNTLTPASGSKTYNVGFYGSGAGTTYISGSSTVPAYLQVELV